MRTLRAFVLSALLVPSALAQSATMSVVNEKCLRIRFERCMARAVTTNPNTIAGWNESRLSQEVTSLFSSKNGSALEQLKWCEAEKQMNACVETVPAPMSVDQFKQVMTEAMNSANAGDREAWTKIFQNMLDTGRVIVAPPPN